MNYPVRPKVASDLFREREYERFLATRELNRQLAQTQRALDELAISKFASEVLNSYPQVAFINFFVFESWGDYKIDDNITVLNINHEPIKKNGDKIADAILDILYTKYDGRMLLNFSAQLLALDELAFRKGPEFLEGMLS